jgi:hypothetical protein
MCNQCKENERKLLVDRPTDSSTAICPPFFEGGHKKIEQRDRAILKIPD